MFHTNVNEVTSIPQVSETGLLVGDIDGGVGSKVQVHRVGESVHSFYLYEHRYDESGNPISVSMEEDQTLMYVDQNEDAIINESDLIVNNNALPDFILGLTSGVAFKQFDLAFTLRSLVGNYVYNNKASDRGFYDKIFITKNAAENLHTSVLETILKKLNTFLMST